MINPSPENLYNDGQFLFYDHEHVEDKSTFLIIGQARAGTTMLSLLLKEMNIFIGEFIGPVHEDNEFQEFVDDLNQKCVSQKFLSLIKKRNLSCDKWAWKRPDIFKYLNHIIPHLRNPRIICIFRDPITIASRNIISTSKNKEFCEETAFQYVNNSVFEHQQLLEAIELNRIPSLLLSYEKTIIKTKKFIQSLLRFTGSYADENKMIRLASLVRPNHSGYAFRARESSFNKCVLRYGYIIGLEGANVNVIVKINCNEEDVELWVDGLCIRKKTIKRDSFKLEQALTFEKVRELRKKTHMIEVRFSQDGNQFFNSPFFWLQSN